MSITEVGPPRLDPAAPPPPADMGRGTLARRLVLQVVALVALVAILLSAITAVAVRTLTLRQLDQQLSEAASPKNISQILSRGPITRGQAPGTVVFAYTDSGTELGFTAGPGGSKTNFSQAQIDTVQAAAAAERSFVITLPDGRYRMRAVAVTFIITDTGQQSPGTAVVGLPMSQVDDVLARVIPLEVALILLATGGAAIGARTLIGSSLRPLNRLRTTANQVSRLELDRGDVDLSVRVPPEDTDPRSEVGQVGIAFNHMLGNVAGALAVRQSSERKLSQFVADASHELRNPLAAIRGYAELTRRSRGELPPDTSFAMARVESEADRMSHLVEDLLLLARLDSGPNLEVGPTDLTETVLNATSDARVAGPDHRWSLSLPPEPVVVRADRHRIHQIVANLLANARTHTPPGTSVEAGVRIEGSEAVISVTDNGPGIPPEIGPSVFERFTRADTSRARADGHQGSGSTGLGLAIVAAVVDAHHGRVWVDSVPGRTQFNVALPLPASVPTAHVEKQDPRP